MLASASQDLSTTTTAAETEPHADENSQREPRPRPVHLYPRHILMVGIGGSLGTALRAGISLAVPAVHHIPVGVFAINITGAFVLGVLLETLALRGPDEGRRRDLRLFVGTGVVGGFTTYSALASDTATLLTTGHIPTAAIYALGSVLAGTLASYLGVKTAMAVSNKTGGRS